MRDWPQATGGEPLIRQLSIPAQPSELDDIGGRNIKQITICTVAGKWGLDMGGLPFGDCLPQRAAVAPEEFPARFVSMARAAFKQLAGLR